MALLAARVQVEAGDMGTSSNEPVVAVSSAMLRRRVWAPALVAALALAGSAAILLLQVTVTNDVEAATRTCGSAFDAITDRSGWEVWWARDLDEPNQSVRTALIRTDMCPAAINLRILLAAMAAIVGILSATLAWIRATGGRLGRPHRQSAGEIARLGRATSWAGALLSIAGVVAIVVLVADADSTLFLHVDRLVVLVVGLIVLIPTFALFVIGRSLALLGTYLTRHERVQDHADA